MNLEQLLEDVTTRNEDEVNALFTKCTEDSRRVAEYREILDKSPQAHRDAMKRVLDEKLKLAQDYVDKYIKTIPEPAESCFSIVNLEKTNNPEIYLMDVLLRVPQAEAFRNGTKGGDGGYNLRCEKPGWSEAPVIF